MDRDTRNVVQTLLTHWGKWNQDDQPDPAEVHYYTVSPMFQGAKWLKEGQAPRTFFVDEAVVEKVEKAILRMFVPRPERLGSKFKERQALIKKWKAANAEFELLQAHYAAGISKRRIGRHLKKDEKTIRNRMKKAEEIFYRHWREAMME